MADWTDGGPNVYMMENDPENHEVDKAALDASDIFSQLERELKEGFRDAYLHKITENSIYVYITSGEFISKELERAYNEIEPFRNALNKAKQSSAFGLFVGKNGGIFRFGRSGKRNYTGKRAF